MSGDEKVTLAKAAKATGVPPRTLRYAAKTGALQTWPKETPFGTIYETTIEEVEKWKGTHKPRVKKL